MTRLVLTAIGNDRAGLVDALAGVIAAHGGNWTESHMAELAGKFAGIVLADVPDQRTDDFVAALAPLGDAGVLDVSVEVAAEVHDDRPRTPYVLDLVGQDRLGVIRDLSSALARLEVSIDELHSETRSAPMAGGLLFEASALVMAPPGVDAAAIEAALGELQDEFMIELRRAPGD